MCRFLDYTMKLGRDFITTRTEGVNNAVDKWQGYLPRNYKFYWSQVWDPLQARKEVAFMWSIWHKAVAVNERRARITPASISKQCIFYLPNTSELVKHKFRDCIQARGAWRWAMYIMHELCRVRIGNYDSFHCKQAMFGERTRKKFRKQIKIWHLLHGITCGPFGSNRMTKSSTNNNSTSPSSNTAFGMNSSCMLKWRGNG